MPSASVPAFHSSNLTVRGSLTRSPFLSRSSFASPSRTPLPASSRSSPGFSFSSLCIVFKVRRCPDFRPPQRASLADSLYSIAKPLPLCQALFSIFLHFTLKKRSFNVCPAFFNPKCSISGSFPCVQFTDAITAPMRLCTVGPMGGAGGSRDTIVRQFPIGIPFYGDPAPLPGSQSIKKPNIHQDNTIHVRRMCYII